MHIFTSRSLRNENPLNDIIDVMNLVCVYAPSSCLYSQVGVEKQAIKAFSWTDIIIYFRIFKH